MNSSPAYNPPLTDSQIRELIQQAKNEDATAKEMVLMTFLPLAKSCAQKYEGMGVPEDDLYQEACYGLLLAIIHYDLSRPETFGTFARHYIEKSIKFNALTKQNSNLPSCYNDSFFYEVRAYMSAAEQFYQEYGRYPSESDMAAYMNTSLLRIRRLRWAANSFLSNSLDLDDFYETTASGTSPRPVEDEVFQKERYLDASDLNICLTKREKEVLSRRCGFTESGEPETFAQISADMGVSMNTAKLYYRVAVQKFRTALGLIPD